MTFIKKNQNNISKSENQNFIYSNNDELKNKLKIDNEKENLEDKLKKLKKENEDIKKENLILKNENNNLLLKITDLQNSIKEKTEYKIKKENLDITDKSTIIDLMLKLESKEKEIKELKNIIEYNSNHFDNLMTVIFYSTDSKIHYSLICKKTDKFINIENKLYEAYPEYKDSENDFFFLVNGQKIKRFKTLEENKIKNSQIITVAQYDND